MDHEAAANEQFDRIAKSITINNYSIPLIGFSWVSLDLFNNGRYNRIINQGVDVDWENLS
jgi:hypothetical protein